MWKIQNLLTHFQDIVKDVWPEGGRRTSENMLKQWRPKFSPEELVYC